MGTSRIDRVLVGGLVALVAASAAALASAVPSITSIDGPADASMPAVRGLTIAQPPPASPARYRVTIVQEWSASTHPTTLPARWHTSPAVLAAHRLPGDMFAVGEPASPGIELMAETGATSVLRSELAATATVGEVDTGGGINGTGTSRLDVGVDASNGHLSLVTMLAPSPDWFVGFSAVQMWDGDAWIDRIEFDLQPYDAGTDSGTRFTSGDIDTQPALPISGPRDSGYLAAVGEGRFGYVVIERIG
jgi:hypothetical protein